MWITVLRFKVKWSSTRQTWISEVGVLITNTELKAKVKGKTNVLSSIVYQVAIVLITNVDQDIQ